MLLEALSTARDIGRLHEIASVLIRHGLGDVVRRLGVAAALERAGKVLHWRVAEGLARKSPPQHVREALEQLGPTFVKLGQILASRRDLLPPEWTDELSRLHEDTTPLALDKILPQLVEDLGAPPEEVFARFEAEPLASASIAQVHAAELRDGAAVVVKVRRPGIKATVEADLRLLSRLAELVEREMVELRRYRPRKLVRQFERSLRNELDFRVEAHHAERLADNLVDFDDIVVPRVYGEWTHDRLLVLERLEGPSIGDWLRERVPRDVDPKRVARVGADAVLHMVFIDGFFHADPHPGNVVLLEGGRLGMLDFGMVGHLNEARRMEFIQLLVGIVERREDEVTDVLLGWSQSDDTDVEALRQDVSMFLDRYHGLPLKHVDLPAVLLDVAALLRDNGLFLPNDVALLLKVLITLDGLGRALDPDFVTVAHVEPFVQKALREHWAPLAVARRGSRELRRLMIGLPRDAARLLAAARRGRLRMAIDLRRLDEFGRELNRSANRLTVGMITSALIVGTSIALTVPGGPAILGLPLFASLGFAAACAAGVWLLWSIFRSRKP